MDKQKELWDKLHKDGYNRFSLAEWTLDDLLKPYKRWLRESKVILDVGCGMGYTSSYLKKHCWRRRLFNKFNKAKEVQVYGIDISEVVIEKAKVKFPDIVFKVCDGKTIPFEDNFFDFIFVSSVTVHIPRHFTENYIREFKRVLKPGGSVLLQLVSFPQLDDIEEDSIPYPLFGPDLTSGGP